MEVWDLYNERRKLTGRTHTRGDAIPQGCYHLVVHVWIRNSQGEYLISQRSADRPTLPLKWECVGGSVLKGETSLDGALRETLEEVGVTLAPQAGKLISSTVRNEINGIRFADILDVWLFEYDGPVDLENATTDEVAQVRWMDKEQIRALYDRGELVYTLGYFFNSERLSTSGKNARQEDKIGRINSTFAGTARQRALHTESVDRRQVLEYGSSRNKQS